MAKRISEIAKELGVTSKAIIEKCLAEGIPQDKVKSHTTTVTVGLEATIREWFSVGSASTAVETTAHVDLEKVRAAPKRATRKKAGASEGASEGDEGGGVATADMPETGIAAPRTTKATKPGRAGTRTTKASASTAAEEAVDETVEAPVTQTTKVGADVVSTIAPSVRPSTGAPVETGAHPASLRRTDDSGTDGGEDGKAKTTPKPAPKPTPTPRMNVPQRPKVVTPAGQQLTTLKKVQLSGPKVVRIEAPERMEPPRRRDSGAEGMPGRGGTGAGDDDGGRSPRRKRTGGAGAGGGDRGGVPARRRGISGTDDSRGGMWRPQDLAEREARLARAEGFLKQRRQQMRKRSGGPIGPSTTPAQVGGAVKIAAPFTIKDLSATTGVKAADIIKRLFMQGTIATVNSGIDPVKAQEIMLDFNIELEVTEARTAEEQVSEQYTKRESLDLRPRPPIVTILGHVDHGKTSLLDNIRKANVAAGEAGGITQATSAFRVPVKVAGDTKHIVFLDTPGHEAFTSMRARGAAITDIVVLVVSAPEGVMPQTIESINHAKAAGVPIVVALNKIDRPDATENRVNQTLSELATAGLNPIEWGGDTEVVRTSATKGEGIEKLLEILDLQGQLLEVKADYAGPARGTVVEAKLEEGRGPTANIIVQDGELKVGDFVVMGRAFGRVRDIIDDRGQRHKTVGPAMPVKISGLDEVPDAGDKFFIVDSLKEAQESAEQRRRREREQQLAQPAVTLDSLLSQMKDAAVKEIRVVVKADVQGSVDVLKSEIEKCSTDEVKVRVLHSGVGGITNSDVLLADASRAVIIGFNVIAGGSARNLAESKGIEIRTYDVIYHIGDDMRKAVVGMLAPEIRQQVLGHAEVRQVFKISKVGTIAGCYVTDGLIERNSLIRVTRGGIVIEKDRTLEQLKRFKDDAKEVKAGMECGMKIVGYDDIKEGDVLECYKNVEVKRTA
ncbi:MAG: translation initiation factor IF-2 [Phycisphaeraceae bacterium]|nr:translation initiation factor IF-2 [Phycisphaeraceae bacterium]